MKESLFKTHEKVIIRTPLNPYTTLFNQEGHTRNLDETVKAFLEDDVFLEGIYWSSPQLYQSISDYKKGNYYPGKEEKLLLALKKYVIRSCTRCTPYGIFAGCGITTISGEDPNHNKTLLRKTRIDMGLLLHIKSAIESDGQLWRYLYYKVNDTVYSLQHQYRFIELIVEEGKSKYQVSSIEQTELLQGIIELGKTKALSYYDIHHLLKDEYDDEEIEAFIKSLVESQFLVSELQLSLTVEDELGRFRSILNRVGNQTTDAAKYIELLSAMECVIQKLDATSLGQISVSDISRLRDLLYNCGITELPEHLFQVDLLKPVPAGFMFPGRSIRDIENAVRMMGRLSSSTSPQEITLNRFKKIFSEKYGDSEVPLLEAVDPESGIGFAPVESIGDVAHNSFIGKMGAVQKENGSISLDKVQLWLQDKMEMPHDVQFHEGIRVTEADLLDLEDKVAELPNQFPVMGTLLPADKIFLQSVGGANANTLLGRFAYMHSDIKQFCKSLSDEEKHHHEEVVFAEIIHIPEERSSNIARRVQLCDYEIPVLATSSGSGRVIGLNDLFISVIKDEIILRSASLNRRVIPRLNNAHNYRNSMIPVYRFLAAIQHQQKPGFSINWGPLANRKRFLPRISYKNIILNRAVWQLHQSDIQAIKKSHDPLTELQVFLKKWQVPQFVCIAEADNELFIDTHNSGYLDILLNYIKKKQSLKLVEWLHDSKYRNETPPFIYQFILPLSKRNITPVSGLRQHRESPVKVQRTFAPGSEWMYFKIYCSAFVSDTILDAVVKPAIASLSEAGAIEKAFFIRYKDPHYHIRFRMLLSDQQTRYQFTVAASLIYELLQPFCNDKSVWKVQLDTYEREIERYGEDAIVRSEAAFYHDSLLLLNCLDQEDFRENEEIRFLAGMKNIDKWLSLFDMDTTARLQFCNKVSESFAVEFDKQIQLQLNVKYRALKDAIPGFMQSSSFENYFETRDVHLHKLRLPAENLGSYIHMSQNRWFATQQRLLEYMTYYFCGRYYNRLLREVPTHIL
ncbi:lantibiotic dehydratase [Chitinophaga ginsengisegetis]|uniref:lantibiotic dehydratase n=1 Tax=Chitinophaga ginsengisegetis TaxID=393003 RepID=UPI0034470521